MIIFIFYNFLNQYESKIFNYNGDIQSINLLPGSYELSVWGASGGISEHCNYTNNTGGYSYGVLTISNMVTAYVVVGGRGTSDGIGGYNGGGSGLKGGTDSGGGGGATHIALSYGKLYELETKKSSVLIVAGGGGGNGCTDDSGGPGGGLVGLTGVGINYGTPGTGGSQTSGGTNGGNTTIASFGLGGSSINRYGSGGGGGGYYGGAAGTNLDSGGNSGGGGSGFISSRLINAKTINGKSVIPSPSGGNEKGHSGNGVAIIKRINFVPFPSKRVNSRVRFESKKRPVRCR